LFAILYPYAVERSSVRLMLVLDEASREYANTTDHAICGPSELKTRS
jgi:hypothetical protein